MSIVAFKAVVSTISAFGIGFGAQWIFTDIPQWAISLHAVNGGILVWLVLGEEPVTQPRNR